MHVDDVKVEHGCEHAHAEGVVHGAVGEEIRPQALLLDLLDYHLPHVLGTVEQIPHLEYHKNTKLFGV